MATTLLLWGLAISPFINVDFYNKTGMPVDLQLYIKGRSFKMPFYPIFLLVILASAK